MNDTSQGVRDDVGRCPQCGARVVAGQDWCSLCLQPLGAPAAPDPEPEPVDAYDPSDPSDASKLDDLSDPSKLDDLSDPNDLGPAHPDGPAGGDAGRDRSSGDLPPLVAEAMLAELAAATAAERPLARGPLAGMSRGMRTAMGCGAAVVLIGVLLLVLTLVGLLL